MDFNIKQKMVIIEKQKRIEELYCDFCQIKMDNIVSEVSFGYGSDFDMKGYIFCSDKCLLNWCKVKIIL
jgi:regulatory protein YycI of two-component signal transduction system YycFG